MSRGAAFFSALWVLTPGGVLGLPVVGAVAVALVLVPWLGYLGACLGSPTAWVLADCFLIPTAYWCLGKLRRRMEPASGEQDGQHLAGV